MPNGGCDLPADAGDYDGLLLLGGAVGALDDHLCRHFPPLMALVPDLVAAGTPVLGICLGAQLMARSFGGRVHSGRDREFGFLAAQPSPAAADDPLLAGTLRSPVILQWHDDSFDLPPGAVPLLEGAPCRWQAFRFGRSAWAFQGHIEVTRETVEAWGRLRARLHDEPETPALLAQHFAGGWPLTEAFGRQVARRWLGLCSATI